MALFVAGDVLMSGRFDIEMAPGAELDMFITNNLNFGGALVFGSTAEPARVRVYTGGDSVTLAGEMQLGANIYAPKARVAAAAALEMSGSLFAHQFTFSGGLTVHYDEAVLKQEGCQPPGLTCGSCSDCGASAPACKNGACGACTTDSDCCAPLSCRAGACVPPPRIP